jgi:hypothetical protein
MRRNEGEQHTTERLEGDNAQYAIGLGLGAHTKPKPRGQYKPRYDPIEFGREMEVAISGFFEIGTQLPTREKESPTCREHGLGEDEQEVLHCMGSAEGPRASPSTESISPRL